MPILDSQLAFTGFGTSGYAPTAAQDNIAPFTIDTSPLGLDSKSGGSSATGYNSGVATNAGRDLGVGTEFWLQVLVTVTFTSGGSATINFQLVTDSTATITTVNILLASGIIALASLTAKSYFRAQLPASGSYKQYLGLDVLIGTTTMTAGTVEGYLLPNIQQSDLYLSGFFVS